MKPLNQQISSKLLAHASKLSQYTQLLQKILPVECRKHVAVANIRNQNLMLITDSPVWTTRLRQLSPQILQFIRESSVNTGNGETPQLIHHVQISTRYSAASANQADNRQQKIASERKKRRPKISTKTAERLSQSANSIEYAPLKAALLSLAHHGKSTDCSDKNKK